MLVTLVGALIVASTCLFIAWPLLVKAPNREPHLQPRSAEREGILELEKSRDDALAALRESQMDHATGKLSNDDYGLVRAELENTALAAIAQLDIAEAGGQEAAGPGPQPKPEKDSGNCANCGHPRQDGARFCGQCGQALSARPRRSEKS